MESSLHSVFGSMKMESIDILKLEEFDAVVGCEKKYKFHPGVICEL
jgi:hypothetical protein